MIKRIILLGLGFLPMILHAQVTINAQLPPGGFVQKDQLWYLILANNKADVIDVNIKMSLQDAVTGQIVMSANSGSILLGKGIKIITSRDIQPITYNYNAADFSRGYLPMGSYIACYQVYHIGEKGDEPLGDECVRINIDPLSPPLLNSPEDKSEVQSPYPQFTWMPPTPFDMFNNLNYEILVTEVMPGQSSTEAIQYNTPQYTKSNILQTYESYPSSFSALDTGKIYAWQVVARNGLDYAVKTEVWTFKIKQAESFGEPVNGIYILLDNDITGTYSVTGDTLHVKYTSRSSTDSTNLVFTDQQGNIVKQILKEIKPGDNYIDLGIGNDFQPGNTYRLTITDAFNRRHSLRFRIN
jgi:hypothetical protein